MPRTKRDDYMDEPCKALLPWMTSWSFTWTIDEMRSLETGDYFADRRMVQRHHVTPEGSGVVQASAKFGRMEGLWSYLEGDVVYPFEDQRQQMDWLHGLCSAQLRGSACGTNTESIGWWRRSRWGRMCWGRDWGRRRRLKHGQAWRPKESSAAGLGGWVVALDDNLGFFTAETPDMFFLHCAVLQWRKRPLQRWSCCFLCAYFAYQVARDNWLRSACLDL